MRLSQRKVKELIKEEKSASKFYVRHGFPQIARDERRHARQLRRLIR